MSDLKISAKAVFDISELVAGAQAARQALAGLGAAGAQAGQQAAGGLDNAGSEAAQAGQRMQQAGSEASRAAGEMADAGQAARSAGQGMQQAGSEASRAAGEMADAGQAARSAGQGMQQAGSEAAQAGQDMQQAGSEAAQAGQDMQQAGSEAAQAGQDMGGMGEGAQGAAGGIAALRLGAIALVAVQVAQWARDAGAAILEAQINAERLQTTLAFAAGSGQVGQEMEWIAGLANRLGLEFNSTAQAYAGWAAATRSSAIAGNEARQVFEGVARAGSVLGLSVERQRDAMTALTQMMSKGAVGAEEFGQQLGEHLPIALEAGAAAMGVTTAEFNKMLESGELITSDFLPKFVGKLNEMTAAQGEFAQTTEAAMNRAANSWTQLKTVIADAGGASAMVAATNMVAHGFENMASRIGTAKALGLGAWGQFLAAMNAPGASVNAQDVDIKKTANQNAMDLLVQQQQRLQKELYQWSPLKTLQQKQAELQAVNQQLAGLREKTRADLRGAEVRSGYQGQVNAARAQADAAARAKKFIEGEDAKNLTEAEQKNKKIQDIQDGLKKATAGLEKNSKEYADAVAAADKRIAEVNKKAGKSGRTGTGTGTGLTAPDRAMADLQARVDAEKTLGEQLAKTGLAQEKLTEGEKLAIKYRQELTAATTKAKKEELERLAKKADELGAQQKQNAATKELLALNQEFSRSAAQRALDLQSINEEAAKEVEWLGLSSEARAVAQAQWELEKQTRREILALQEKMAAAASEEGRAAIAAEIERVRAAASEKSTAVAAATAAKTASSEAARMSQDIERALTDSLMRGFDNGKGAIKSLKDYAVNAFKGWTVKIALQPVMGQVNQVAQQLSASVSTAMKSGGGLQNLTPSNIIGDKAFGGIGKMSIGDAMGSWYPSDMLQSFSQSGVGELFGLSDAAGALTQAGADLTAGAANMADLAGSVGSWVSVGIDAFNSLKTGEGWGKTVGSAIGTYILPGIGTAIGSTLGGMIDDAFGGKGGPKSGGNANAIYTADGQAVAREMFGGYTPNEMDAAFKTAVDGIQTQYATMVKSLGGVAKDLTINLGGDTDPKGDAGNRISAQIAVGQVGAGMGSADAERALWGASAYSKVSASAGSDLTQAVKEESARMLVAALKASDLPADIATAFNSIDVQTASIEQVNAALAQAQALMLVVSAFKQYDTVLPGLAALSLSAKQALVSFSGGIETLQGRLSSYYNNYFSAAEKETRVRQQLSEKLASVNIALPKTREEFRAVLESLDKSSEAGQRATAAMLEVNEAFASITKSAAELAQVLRDEFSAAAAEAAKTLAALKTARQGILSVDKWLVTAGAGGQAYNDQRRGALWQMFDGGQLAAEQQLELLQELQGLIQDRYQAEINAVLELTQNAQRLRDAARSIRDYVQSLKTGELSPYTMGERLAESASQFFITVAQARSGDETALGQVQEKAGTYLQLGQDYYGSNEGYSGSSGIFANVLATLEGLGLGLDGMSAGQDAAALAAQAQARYSQQAIAEMQRLRAGFASVENVLQNQLVAQTSAAAQILAKMTGPEQLAALRALPAEIAALIRGQLTIQQAAQQAVSQSSSSVVDQWYRDSLSREGEAAGKDYWNQTIGRVGQQAAYQSFQYNAQIENNVKSIYREVLGREADAAGAEYWVNQIKSGVGYDTARAAIAASDEARARLPQFAVGAERLPSDMIAQLHKGEGIIPAWANTRMLDAVERGAGAPAGGGSDLAGLRAELRQLREVTERQALMIERLLSALGRAVLDSSAENADRIVDGVAAAGQIDSWRAGARRPVLA